jgi:hypothetical protein
MVSKTTNKIYVKTNYISKRLATEYEPIEGEATLRYEFIIPTITGDEKGLKTLADKNGLDICYGTREQELPPIVRILTKEVSVPNLYEADKFLTKVDRALDRANVRMAYNDVVETKSVYCYILTKNMQRFMSILSAHYPDISTAAVEGKFLRKDRYDIDISSVVPIVSDNYFTNGLYLSRDSRDPEDVWNLYLYFSHHTIRDPSSREATIEEFTRYATKELNVYDYKYILQLV